jgi:hypothetical protein
MYKTLQQFTSSFTLNTNIFTNTKSIKAHIQIFTEIQKLLKMPNSFKLRLIKTVSEIWPNETMSHFSLSLYKVYFSKHKLLFNNIHQNDIKQNDTQHIDLKHQLPNRETEKNSDKKRERARDTKEKMTDEMTIKVRMEKIVRY